MIAQIAEFVLGVIANGLWMGALIAIGAACAVRALSQRSSATRYRVLCAAFAAAAIAPVVSGWSAGPSRATGALREQLAVAAVSNGPGAAGKGQTNRLARSGLPDIGAMDGAAGVREATMQP